MSVSWKIITFALQRDFHPSSLIIFEKVSLLIDSLKFRIYIGAKRIFLIIAGKPAMQNQAKNSYFYAGVN